MKSLSSDCERLKEFRVSFLVVLLLLAVFPVLLQGSSALYYWKLDPIEPAGGGGAYTSIDIDSLDRPHVAYKFGVSTPKYAHWTGSEWISESFDSNARHFPSLKLDSLDRPHIAYLDRDYHLGYAHWNGVSWEVEVVDSDYDTGFGPSLAIDSSEYPHIAYYDRKYDYDLKYAYWDGVNWHVETVDSYGKVGAAPSIALDSFGKTHIVYGDIDNSILKYARWDGSDWVIENLTSFGSAWFPSLALDSFDRPHVSFLNATWPYYMMYAKLTGISWDIETVAPHGNRGETPSLALDSLNRPHISYGNMSDTGQGLGYAHWTGTKWESQMVKHSGGVHAFSIALDSTDRPHICFYDGPAGYIMHATTTPTPLPDLSTSTTDLSLYPLGPVLNGTTVMVNATVHNIGYSDASNVLVRFYDMTPPESKIDGDIIIGSIPVGGQNLTQVEWNASSLGLHNICVFVDPLNNIEEVDETNNDACRSIYVYDLPDIVSKSFTSDPPSPVTTGTFVTLNATFSNEGGEDASNFDVAFFEDSNQDRIIQTGEEFYTETVSSLGAGESTSIYYFFTAQLEGSYDVCVWADPPPSVVEESNESNNLLCMDFVIFHPVYPRPPSNLTAELIGSGFSDVLLSWDLSPDDGNSSNPVIGYDILRGTSYERNGTSYALCCTVPNATSQYVDIAAGEGDSNDYFYMVCAVNSAGNSSCSENQAGKFTRPLSKGPNLISIPLIQSNESIEIVLQTVEFDKVWTYDLFSGKWKWYMSFKPYKGTLRTIDYAMGLWINVTTDSNLTVAGVVPLTTSIELMRGWNLVSYPSFEENYTVADLKLEINATRVEGFASSSEPYFLVVMQDVEKLRAGYTYWIEVPEDIFWLVSN